MTGRVETWAPAESWPGPTRGAIDVWRCALRASPEVVAAKHALLSDVERARAARFRREQDRAAYVLVRGTLRERLAACLDVRPEAVRVAETLTGKPVLAAACAADGVAGAVAEMERPCWEFNVSHSGEIGLIALAWDRALGVDVEAHRAKIDGPELAKHYFSAREREALAAMTSAGAACASGKGGGVQATGVEAEAEYARWFFATWTRKEAFLKATGQGLSFPLDKFSVTVAPDEAPELLELEGEPEPSRRWRLWSLSMPAGYSGALAAARKPDEPWVIVRGWEITTCGAG